MPKGTRQPRGHSRAHTQRPSPWSPIGFDARDNGDNGRESSGSWVPASEAVIQSASCKSHSDFEPRLPAFPAKAGIHSSARWRNSAVFADVPPCEGSRRLQHGSRLSCFVSEDWRDGARLWQAVCFLREQLMPAAAQLVPVVHRRDPRARVATVTRLAARRAGGSCGPTGASVSATQQRRCRKPTAGSAC